MQSDAPMTIGDGGAFVQGVGPLFRVSVALLTVPSVNVICATSPDGFATAVAVNVTPKSR